ncbi:putative transposase [Rhizobium sp. PP-CC-2G-626]|nr:putative transposase [Rhizobium sp. PP-CC-2G-626]
MNDANLAAPSVPYHAQIPEGILGLSDVAWIEAKRRAAIIAPLAEHAEVPARTAREAGTELGLTERTVYSLIRRYRQSGGLLSSLAPKPPSGGKGKTRLPFVVETIIGEAIRDEFLTRQKKRAAAVVRAVRERCATAGIAAPATNTIRARVQAIRSEEAAKRREGGARSKAARRLKAAAGETPESPAPMAVLQIDHTPVDIILVDETYRKPLGRPYLTVAIDVYSRCVAGFLLSFDPPSATSVGLCIAHAASPKDGYLASLGFGDYHWPVSGMPGAFYVDNAAEFHSEALTRGCEQYGIALNYRPVATPHYGGIVERLIGTLMQMIHEVPGTTFSNIAERSEYDSDGNACLTLAELEQWMALAIVGRYHGEVHGGLLEPPVARWHHGVSTVAAPRPVSQTQAFLVDFLPVVRRRITREGFRLDHIAYFSNALHPWVAERDRMDPFVIRRDPRDLSRIYVLDPVGQFYVEVPCARLGRPSITLFEHREAVARLRADGRSHVDEEAIFRAVAAQRELAREAATRTRSARRKLARIAGKNSLSFQPEPTKRAEDAEPQIVVTQLYPATKW